MQHRLSNQYLNELYNKSFDIRSQRHSKSTIFIVID